MRSAVAFAGRELLGMLSRFAIEASALPLRAKALDLQALRDHATDVAKQAKKAAGESPHAEACFVAGMLHDVGKLVLATRNPETFDAVATRARIENISFEQAESAEGIRSHTMVGAALVDLWGLPQTVVDAVAKQHTETRDFDYLHPTAALRLAHGIPLRSVGRR